MHQRHQESDGRSTRQVAIACDVNAVPAERRDRWVEIGRQVFAAVEEVRELPDGYRFRVPTSSAMLLQVAEYVSNERLCCGFLRFQVEVEPAQGPVWLQLTGAEGAKGYMRTVFAASRLPTKTWPEPPVSPEPSANPPIQDGASARQSAGGPPS